MRAGRSTTCLGALLLVLFITTSASAQRLGETLDPATVYPDHQPGADVALPPLKDLRLVTHHGDTAVLLYARVIPSQRRALSSVQIYYRYTIGEATGRVVYRQVSTGTLRQVALGSDGVVAIHNGSALLDGDPEKLERAIGFGPAALPKEPNGFAAVEEKFKNDNRELVRRPIATPHGLLYQEAIREDDRYKPGAIYYAPRDGRDYLVEEEVLVAEAGFSELGLRNDFYPGFRQGDKYVVLFNKNKTAAKALDLETRVVRTFDLNAPDGSDRWGPSGHMMDDRYLYAAHGLYDLKTGQRAAVRTENPGKTRIYHHPVLMHNRVSYGLTRNTLRDGTGKIKGTTYTLWARPVLDNGDRAREITTFEDGRYVGQLFAGEDGPIYSDTRRWIKMDWLSPDDFDQNKNVQ